MLALMVGYTMLSLWIPGAADRGVGLAAFGIGGWLGPPAHPRKYFW